MKFGIGMVAVLAVLWTAPAQAGDPPSQYKSQDVIDAYMGKSPTAKCPAGTVAGDDGICDPKVNARGFSLATPTGKGGKASRASGARAANGAYRPSARMKPAVSPSDLLINFELGSAELTPQGRSNARAFAEALNAPALAAFRFALAGHTDVTGSADLNASLSQSRADAVKDFLVAQGVAADRLDTKGYGSQRLADPAHPRSPANRRVEGVRLN